MSNLEVNSSAEIHSLPLREVLFSVYMKKAENFWYINQKFDQTLFSDFAQPLLLIILLW